MVIIIKITERTFMYQCQIKPKKMKSFQSIVLLGLLALLLAGCDKLDTPPVHSCFHFVGISIEDTAGKDLVATLGDEQWVPPTEHTTKWSGTINPERYVLRIVKSDNTVWAARTMEERKELEGPYFILGNEQSLKADNGTPYSGCWLCNVYRKVETKGAVEPEKHLTYRLTCPEIFGDSEEHDIETYWDVKSRTGFETYPECTKAVFEGKELAVNKLQLSTEGYKDHYVYCIKIVLDR